MNPVPAFDPVMVPSVHEVALNSDTHGSLAAHQINVPAICQGGERDGGMGGIRPIDDHVGIRPQVRENPEMAEFPVPRSKLMESAFAC